MVINYRCSINNKFIEKSGYCTFLLSKSNYNLINENLSSNYNVPFTIRDEYSPIYFPLRYDPINNILEDSKELNALRDYLKVDKYFDLIDFNICNYIVNINNFENFDDFLSMFFDFDKEENGFKHYKLFDNFEIKYNTSEVFISYNKNRHSINISDNNLYAEILDIFNTSDILGIIENSKEKHGIDLFKGVDVDLLNIMLNKQNMFINEDSYNILMSESFNNDIGPINSELDKLKEIPKIVDVINFSEYRWLISYTHRDAKFIKFIELLIEGDSCKRLCSDFKDSYINMVCYENSLILLNKHYYPSIKVLKDSNSSEYDKISDSLDNFNMLLDITNDVVYNT